MAVTISKSTVTGALMNTPITVTKNLATADTDALAEVFTVTPTEQNTVLLIGGTGSGADGDMTYSIAAGVAWAGVVVTGTITKNTEKMVPLDTAKVLSATGTIVITLTPAGTDKLVTDHAAYMKFLQLV